MLKIEEMFGGLPFPMILIIALAITAGIIYVFYLYWRDRDKGFDLITREDPYAGEFDSPQETHEGIPSSAAKISAQVENVGQIYFMLDPAVRTEAISTTTGEKTSVPHRQMGRFWAAAKELAPNKMSLSYVAAGNYFKILEYIAAMIIFKASAQGTYKTYEDVPDKDVCEHIVRNICLHSLAEHQKKAPKEVSLKHINACMDFLMESFSDREDELFKLIGKRFGAARVDHLLPPEELQAQPWWDGIESPNQTIEDEGQDQLVRMGPDSSDDGLDLNVEIISDEPPGNELSELDALGGMIRRVAQTTGHTAEELAEDPLLFQLLSSAIKISNADSDAYPSWEEVPQSERQKHFVTGFIRAQLANDLRSQRDSNISFGEPDEDHVQKAVKSLLEGCKSLDVLCQWIAAGKITLDQIQAALTNDKISDRDARAFNAELTTTESKTDSTPELPTLAYSFKLGDETLPEEPTQKNKDEDDKVEAPSVEDGWPLTIPDL